MQAPCRLRNNCTFSLGAAPVTCLVLKFVLWPNHAALADDVHARDRTAAAAAAAAAAAEVAVGRSGRKRKRKQPEKQSKQQQKARKDEEFGVTRGIDFKGVRSIINFDIPDSVQV
jgi:hypothetical protein